jgi:glycosyltransferase involved in cell wall biosynthesis
MPRIAMLIQKYYPHVGGAERQIQRLAPRLQARGFEVCVVTRHAPGLSRFEMVDGVPVYRLVCPGPKPVAALLYISSAFRLLSRLRPDVVHAHEILSPASTALLAKRFYGWPVVVKVLRGGLRGDVYKLKRSPFWRQRFDALCRGVDSFVVISREIEQELSALGVPTTKRAFIPNGVDTENYAPVSASQKHQLRTSLQLPPDGMFIIYLGRLTFEKRVDHLLQIWPDIRTAFPGAHLLIVGSGPEEARLRAQSGPVAGVTFTGQTNDALHYLQAADIFVLPSATEGLSNSLLEALSTGLPVLATSVGGTPDVISHGVNGYLIPSEDLPALKRGLMELLANATLRTRLGIKGRERMLTDFSLDSVALRLDTLYHTLLKT